MRTKIGLDGKPYDASDRARKAMDFIRARFADADKVEDLLNAVADRLQTCDALEQKVVWYETRDTLGCGCKRMGPATCFAFGERMGTPGTPPICECVCHKARPE